MEQELFTFLFHSLHKDEAKSVSYNKLEHVVFF